MINMRNTVEVLTLHSSELPSKLPEIVARVLKWTSSGTCCYHKVLTKAEHCRGQLWDDTTILVIEYHHIKLVDQ
jgi:hypothetical protein